MEQAVTKQCAIPTPGRVRPTGVGPIAWLLVVVLATPIIEAILKGHFATPAAPIVAFASLAACLGTLAYLSLRNAPSRAARCIRVAIITACALGVTVTRLTLGTPEYVPTLFSCSIYLLALLVLDGHVGVGLGVGLLVLGSAGAQVALTGEGLTEYLSLAYLLIILLLALAWKIYVGRIIKRGNEFDSRSAKLLERRRADVRELTMLRLRSALTTSGADNVLTRVLDADRVDDQLMDDVRLAEARLRDHLSAPIFSHSVFADEVAYARSRGVSVRLLGETLGTKKDGVIEGPLVAMLVEVLQNAKPGDSVVIRHVPGSSPDRFTVVSGQDDEVTRMEIDELGNRLVTER